MQLTRAQKEQIVDEMAAQMDESQVVGVLDMHSLPARQLQEIKKELAGEADIRMSRKTLINRALDQSSRDSITDLKEHTAIQPALIFTDKNPFSLYKLIQEKKSSAKASGGETAPNDIVLEAGKTDLDPGPMLGRIQQLGAGTEVEDGKIAIQNDAVAVEEGDVIDTDTAEILNKLGMEPLEVGLDLKLAYEDGDVFDKDVLAIDADAYLDDLAAAASGAFNLAVNAGYLTERTREPLVQQAFTRARSLAINAGVIDEAVIDDLVNKGVSSARALDEALDLEAAAEQVDEDDGADKEPQEDAEASEAGGEDEQDDEDASTEDTDDNDTTSGEPDEDKNDGGDQ